MNVERFYLIYAKSLEELTRLLNAPENSGTRVVYIDTTFTALLDREFQIVIPFETDMLHNLNPDGSLQQCFDPECFCHKRETLSA